jgi:NtrC-family two-component system response regulator AlgB
MSLAAQAKFLRVLQEREFQRLGATRTLKANIRVIAATNRDLRSEVNAGRFRSDLYYRLAVVSVRVPPLRERTEDLPALLDHLLASLAARHHRARPQLTPDAAAAIAAYPWPGNVRELANALERALVLARGDAIGAESLPDAVHAPPRDATAPADTSLSLEDVERRHIQQVVASSATLEDAAARLGIDPTTLWRKRRRWGLD